MSRSKKEPPKQSVWARLPGVGWLTGLLNSPYRVAMLGVAILGLFFALWAATWSAVHERVFASQQFWLTFHNVQITPLPEWIHSDIRAEVFRDASLDRPLSIMDDDLAERITNAFKLHPWIAEVRLVRKRHPAQVTVDLVYRRPVCMVQVPGGLLPVDVNGVLLPTVDFSPLEAARYPRLVGIDTVPIGPPGERWGDARVVGAAEIAAAFGPAWARLGLERITPSGNPSAGRFREETYDLYSRGNSPARILWGRAPSCEMPGDVPANEKVARLEKVAAERGPLDGPNVPRELDLRSPEPSASDRRTATRAGESRQ